MKGFSKEVEMKDMEEIAVEFYSTNTSNAMIHRHLNQKGMLYKEDGRLFFTTLDKCIIFCTSLVSKIYETYMDDDSYYVVLTKNSLYRFKLL